MAYTITEIQNQINKRSQNGYITRQSLQAIKESPHLSPPDVQALHKILNTGLGIGKQMFTLTTDLQAFYLEPYTIAAVWNKINEKSYLVDYKRGVGISRTELLNIIQDSRTPFGMQSKLSQVLNTGNQEYYCNNEFKAVFNK